MNRYLNSFFVTTIIYFILAFFIFFTFSSIIIYPLEKETKISLSNISLSNIGQIVKQESKQIIQESKSEEKPEAKTEPIIKKNKPKPIEKVIEKKQEAVKVVKQMKENIKKEVVNIKTASGISEIKQDEISNIDQTKIDNVKTKYLAKIQAIIEKNKVYPKSAKRLNQMGKVEISFDIAKNGEIKNIKILKTSSFKKLDEASIELLVSIGNFDEIPKEIKENSLNITVPINYRLE